jgi:hypothetical protein
MTTRTYKNILSLLHPDCAQDPELKQRYAEAFVLWKGLEKVIPFELTFEERTGTPKAKMPRPMAKTTRELWEARGKAPQKRSEWAKRAAATRKARQAAARKVG